MYAHGDKPANVDADDPMCGLIKCSFDIYDKPVEFKFDGSKFGIVDVCTKGSNAQSNAQPSRESDGDVTQKMGLYVQRKDGTLGLVAMGKMYEGPASHT